MNKQQFLEQLRRRLDFLPEAEVGKSLGFYAECIDDRMEDGMSEEEAVAALGDLDAIVREIAASQPLSTIVRQRVKSEREKKGGGKGWWIALAILGSPLWLALLCVLCALAVVALVVYVCVWAVVLSLFVVLGALVVSGVGFVIYALVRLAALGAGGVLMLLGGAAVCVGLALALFAPLCMLVKAIGRATAGFGRWLKGRLWGKGGTER